MDALDLTGAENRVTAILESKFLVVGGPDLSESEENAVSKVLRSGWLGNGPIASRFEYDFVESLNTSKVVYPVALNSCTMGLILALRAEGIGQGDEVITTPLTFAATVNAILSTGAKVVLADVDSIGRIDPFEIGKRITARTKAIIPVHLHGKPCDMDRIMAIAGLNKLLVIEDAAHAFGGTYNGLPLGTIGHYGVFSFYPTKNITTGDGGIVLCKDKVRADYIRVMASQGLSAGAWKRYGSGPIANYQVEAEGYKGLMNDLNAAIGVAQLKRWPEMKERRAEVFKVYEDELGSAIEGHSHHIYAIQHKKRDALRQFLYERGIGTGIHYNPLHKEPAYEFWADKYELPMAERIGSKTLSLPLTSTMNVEDAERVVKVVKEFGEGI